MGMMGAGRVADDGTFARPDIEVVLSGEPTLAWAVHAAGVQFPLNARVRFVEVESGNTAACLRWPTSQWLSWNAVLQAWQEGMGEVRVGAAVLQRRDRVGSRVCDLLAATPRPLPVQPVAAPDPAVPPERTVVLAIPTISKTLPLSWATAFLGLRRPPLTWLYLAAVYGYEVAEARERLVGAVLAAQPGPRWLLFYGDDMAPKPDALEKLLDAAERHDLRALSGLYAFRGDPPGRWMAWRQVRDGLLRDGRDLHAGEFVEASACGLDFCLLRTDALRALDPPLFRSYQVQIDRRAVAVTEDVFFWRRWRSVHGRGPILHTGVVVEHLDVANRSSDIARRSDHTTPCRGPHDWPAGANADAPCRACGATYAQATGIGP